jgi:hypothetical protein
VITWTAPTKVTGILMFSVSFSDEEGPNLYGPCPIQSSNSERPITLELTPYAAFAAKLATQHRCVVVPTDEAAIGSESSSARPRWELRCAFWA